MEIKKDNNKYLKFLLYLVTVILINLAGTTLFFRIDLTKNDVYSLSKMSKKVVANLSEPLTVKVFFTGDLPSPYNGIERYLHDLLQEYSVEGNKYFNYQFYNVSGEQKEEAEKNQKLARDYGISPVQIQNIEHDEVKFQRAYMGMALIHGDIIETIPAIVSTEGLEFKITSTIRNISNKISALLSLEDNISVKLFLSSSLKAVGPYINLTGISEIPSRMNRIVERLNERNYGKLSFVHLDPTMDKSHEEEARQYDIPSFSWDAFKDKRGQTIAANNGYAGIVVQYGDKSEEVQLLNVVRLPIFGTQYQMNSFEDIEENINDIVENMVNVNEEIGYLADHGTPEMQSMSHMFGMADDESLSNFNKLLSEQYTIKNVTLTDGGIPEGLPSLIIAGARKKFSDYELYQIDQYLMKGRNLAIFLDAFEERMQDSGMNRMQFMQPPTYVPINTGLEKLLSHYGFKVTNSYVLDENCYKQRVEMVFGGGEQPIYFAPIIKNEFINKDAEFLKNIKGLVMLKVSSLDVDNDKLSKNDLTAKRLFSSSEKSWEMKGQFNPMYINPPHNEDEYKQFNLAYVIEGSFPSYFADKPIPEMPADEKAAGEKEKESGIDTSSIETKGATIKKGKPGKIFLIGSSEILKDNIIDEGGESPNAQFALNMIDYLNGREDYAVMRSKSQRFNPLEELKAGTKTIIKSANIAGMPVLVILAGLIVWVRRASRKRNIQQLFRK